MPYGAFCSTVTAPPFCPLLSEALAGDELAGAVAGWLAGVVSGAAAVPPGARVLAEAAAVLFGAGFGAGG
jgi:hypothetical protein